MLILIKSHSEFLLDLSFVRIDPNTGLVSKIKIRYIGAFYNWNSEPFNKNNIKKLDNLSSINNNSISGTGSLLSQ